MPGSQEALLIASSALFFEDEHYRAVGDGIIRKRPYLGRLFKLIGLLSFSRLGNALLIMAVILGYRALRVPGDGPLFQYGNSENNRRAFRRANAVASRSEWDAQINGEPLSLQRRLRVIGRMCALWRMAGALSRGRSASAFVHTQLVLTGAAQLVFSCQDFIGVRCICVASDHSPIVMGLLDVARRKGIRICYIQHAPVAQYFPPLDYDLSILFDRSSISTYERAAVRRHTSNKGKILILPPFDTDSVQPRLGRGGFRIGVCLSYLFNANNLIFLIDQLVDHPMVANVRLRRHPRCRAELSELMRHPLVCEPVWGSLSGFAEECDIVLVPNSGVAIELLHMGKPVFYTPDMDFIGYDYYGFVESGVIPLFASEWLDDPDRVGAFFGMEWRKRYAKFDETIATPLAASHAIVGHAFRSLVEN